MTYAMILQNRVIDVLLNQEKEPHWPPTPEGTPVITVECDESVERGMMYDAETGTFLEYIPPEPETPELTPLTEQEEIALDTALNVEYMVCLLEESLGLE